MGYYDDYEYSCVLRIKRMLVLNQSIINLLNVAMDKEFEEWENELNDSHP